MVRVVVGTCVVLLSACWPVQAQTLPSEPVTFANGRVTLSSDISVTFGSEDYGFFNYTDYEHSALRLALLALTASVQATDHLSVLADIRSQNGEVPEAYGLYVRIKPWSRHSFDIQVGRVPPTFGAFSRRNYAKDNLLIGYPLGYQYLTSLRSDALPADADELLRMRGRGWLTRYSVGDMAANPGVPLATAFRWDTGVQVHGASDKLDATVSVAAGTLSNPKVGNGSGGPHVAGRLAYHPVAGLVVGGSVSSGRFVSEAAADAAFAGSRVNHFTQRAWGADVEYSADYYLVRFEAIISNWTIPLQSLGGADLSLQAVSTLVEGRYKIGPRLYAAARAEHLGFSDITGSALGTNSWDAPVTRVELGGGYSIQRNLLLKVSYQHDDRPAGEVQHANLVAAQLSYWF